MQTSYRTLMTCGLLAASGPLFAQAAEEPWANDPAVQAVLEQRRQSIEVMTSTGPSAASERYSPTFVANTPAGGVVTGETMLQIFASGTIRYDAVEQQIDYAGSHGPDMVVLMGEEIVVPGSGPDSGKRVRRRFTDVFRRIDGQWWHDLRHANVIGVE